MSLFSKGTSKTTKMTKQTKIIIAIAVFLVLSMIGGLANCISSCNASRSIIDLPSYRDSSSQTTTKTEPSESKTDNSSVSNSAEQSDAKSDAKSDDKKTVKPAKESVSSFSLSSVPVYSVSPYATVNNNIPFFTQQDYTTDSYEYYSDLDSLGRCGVCVASIGKDLMPTQERGSISSIKPSGWQTVKYDNVDGKYLYNRCHLIGYQLSGENDNQKNLITGTRYLNVQGMLPFENMVADYVKETGNHVLYRSTPVFDGNNLLASGVLLEGYSVEDNGSGICFNVFCYNVQPDISIDYATGNSSFVGTRQTEPAQETKPAQETEPVKEAEQTNTSAQNTESTYILNTSSKKFHYPSCSSVDQIGEKNRQTYNGSRDALISQGYVPCKRCNP